MAELGLQLEELTAFKDAVAGHHGVLTDPSGELVIKPCTSAESNFYQTCLSDHPEFASLQPTFMGMLSLATPTEQAIVPTDVSLTMPITSHPGERSTDGLAHRADHDRFGPKLETGHAIVLENIAAGFKRPSIIDIKLGIRLWDDNAPAMKRTKLDKVAAETTSATLGFRITGMQVWEASGESGLGEYKVFDKAYGRTFSETNVRKGLERFFAQCQGEKMHIGADRRMCLELCEVELAAIEGVLEKAECRLYSASVLIVMEGDAQVLAQKLTELQKVQEQYENQVASEDSSSEAIRLPKILSLKLIDFAHSEWTPGKGPDENVLQGIRSLRSLVNEIIAT